MNPRPLLAGGATAALLAVAVLARTQGAPAVAPAQTQARDSTVTAEQLACPLLTSAPGFETSQVFAAASRPAGGTATGAVLAATSGPDPSAPPAPAPQPLLGSGVATASVPAGGPALPVPPEGAAVAVDIEGPLAGVTSVLQSSRSDGGALRGRTLSPCTAATSDTWLAGVATTPGSSPSLQLVNPLDTEAVVDLGLLTDTGPVTPSAARGIRVPAQSSRLVDLVALAPDSAALAVHVQTESGRVSPALLARRASPQGPQGVAVIPPQGPAAPQLTVPGLPGLGASTLVLANTADTDAVAEIELSTATDLFVPQGLDQVPVPAGQSVRVDLSPALAGAPGAVSVRSLDAQPLVATAEVTDGTPEIADVAYLVAAQPLSSPAVLSTVPATGPIQVQVLLTATAQEGPPALVALRRGEQSTVVEVAGGRSAAVDLMTVPGEGDVVVEPQSGPPVYATQVVLEQGARGPLLAAATLRSPRAQAAVPAVTDQGETATG